MKLRKDWQRSTIMGVSSSQLKGDNFLNSTSWGAEVLSGGWNIGPGRNCTPLEETQKIKIKKYRNTYIKTGDPRETAFLLQRLSIIIKHDFVFITCETMGPINSEGQQFLNELGHRMTKISGDPRECTFLYQRISVIIQRCNAIAFRGSFCDNIILSTD